MTTVDIIKICKDFGKALVWVAGIVTATVTIALFLSFLIGLNFTLTTQIVVILCVIGFLVLVVYRSLKHYIRKEIYEILKNEKLVKANKRRKNEK